MIGLLFTGGTIAMRLDPRTGAAVPSLTASDILAQIPSMRQVADFEVEEFSQLPGPHVTPAHMWRLAQRAAVWLARPEIDGLVITHGTDTIEETAYLLDLVLTTSKPVVLVGAMRTVSDPSWDGPGNLIAAARVAATPITRDLGVLVVMDEQILAAREARKVHTESSSSFSSPEFGPLGVIDAGTVLLRRRTVPRAAWLSMPSDTGLRIAGLETRVDLVQAYTGMDDRLVQVLVANGARGVAVIGFGRGNVPPALVPGIKAAVDAGLVVTISSRSSAGRVGARYGYEGGGLHLQQTGAILAGDLSGAKARLLQMVALSCGADLESARQRIADAIATH